MSSDSEKVLEIFKERSELFEAKNSDYGNSWKKTGQVLKKIIGEDKSLILRTEDDFITFGVLTRMLDKYIRYVNLRFGNVEERVGEKLAETIGDEGVYAFMLESLSKE